MKVRVIAYTVIDEEAMHGEGWITNADDTEVDELSEFAGRLCYKSWSRPNPKTATNEGYLDNILSMQHHSVLEHSSVTFAISGVSRSFTHELVRHRHLSFSQVSQRYVDESEAELVYPPGASDDERALLHDLHARALWTYKQIIDYREKDGAKRKEARQAARAALLNATETRIVVTGNVRSWRDVLTKRLAPGADVEFQLVAREILNHLHQIAPNSIQDIWEQYGQTTD